MEMRNQPSPKTGRVDIIDRHIKGRCLIVDSRTLMMQNTVEVMMLLIDIADISDYYDVIVIADKDEVNYIQEFVDHWGLKAQVIEEYTEYDGLLEKYKIMALFTIATQAEKMRRYYRTIVFAR